MNQTERIADGKRRFFPALGKVHEVYLRDKRKHSDRALERGRDYEIETGGVALRTVPKEGETVVILTGDRTITVPQHVIVERVETVREIERPVEVLRLVETPAPPVHQAPAAVTQPARAARDRSSDPNDLRGLQDFLTVIACETCEHFQNRTAEWQDEFAQLTAVMRAATTIEDVYQRFGDIEDFLRG